MYAYKIIYNENIYSTIHFLQFKIHYSQLFPIAIRQRLHFQNNLQIFPCKP